MLNTLPGPIIGPIDVGFRQISQPTCWNTNKIRNGWTVCFLNYFQGTFFSFCVLFSIEHSISVLIFLSRLLFLFSIQEKCDLSRKMPMTSHMSGGKFKTSLHSFKLLWSFLKIEVNLSTCSIPSYFWTSHFDII